MNKHDKALIEEAVRLLEISDEPGLYIRLRRWAREHIKHESNAPIDHIFWPKGILMCGLMHKAIILRSGDTSADRAVSVYAMASVQNYLDKWISSDCPVYYIDDCLAGWALLMLSAVYRTEDPVLHDKYMGAARLMMDYLKRIDDEYDGVIPYRPLQKTGVVFADGIGMVVPFAVTYGLMNSDDDAIDLGVRQARLFMEQGIDVGTGLPVHFFKPEEESRLQDEGRSRLQDVGSGEKTEPTDETSDKVGTFRTSGSMNDMKCWGRSLGWLMYGMGGAVEMLTEIGTISPIEISALKELHGYLVRLKDAADKYRRPDGLFGSFINEETVPVDTSASAMIMYGLSQAGGGERADITPLEPYIRSTGRVEGAQGECLGPGIYSDNYSSYPWSVGATLML